MKKYIVSIEKKDEQTLLYKKNFLLKKGIHPKEEYKNYRKFLKEVVKYENLRIALQKNKMKKRLLLFTFLIGFVTYSQKKIQKN